jgi:hypothetical protein
MPPLLFQNVLLNGQKLQVRLIHRVRPKECEKLSWMATDKAASRHSI